jgi:hypothetical protein
MEATKRKMVLDYIDKDGDGKLTFEDILGAEGGEINIPKEEKKSCD